MEREPPEKKYTNWSFACFAFVDFSLYSCVLFLFPRLQQFVKSPCFLCYFCLAEASLQCTHKHSKIGASTTIQNTRKAKTGGNERIETEKINKRYKNQWHQSVQKWNMRNYTGSESGSNQIGMKTTRNFKQYSLRLLYFIYGVCCIAYACLRCAWQWDRIRGENEENSESEIRQYLQGFRWGNDNRNNAIAAPANNNANGERHSYSNANIVTIQAKSQWMQALQV